MLAFPKAGAEHYIPQSSVSAAAEHAPSAPEGSILPPLPPLPETRLLSAMQRQRLLQSTAVFVHGPPLQERHVVLLQSMPTRSCTAAECALVRHPCGHWLVGSALMANVIIVILSNQSPILIIIVIIIHHSHSLPFPAQSRLPSCRLHAVPRMPLHAYGGSCQSRVRCCRARAVHCCRDVGCIPHGLHDAPCANARGPLLERASWNCGGSGNGSRHDADRERRRVLRVAPGIGFCCGSGLSYMFNLAKHYLVS